MKYSCHCCGYLTLREPRTYEVCPVCFWEDDPVQASDPELSGGANAVTLSAARTKFLRFRASEERFAANVRAPNSDESP